MTVEGDVKYQIKQTIIPLQRYMEKNLEPQHDQPCYIHFHVTLRCVIKEMHSSCILYYLCFRRGLELLVSPNGWVDKVMNIGIKGMFNLIGRG